MTKYKIDYINQNILTKKFYYNTNTDESDNNKFILHVNCSSVESVRLVSKSSVGKGTK